MKKTKLFLSICMMCLCISFLYFGIYGVYAAQSIAYILNGTITYMAEIELVDFYLELGQVSPTNTKKIKWKLVYLDNTSWNALSDNWSTMTNKQKENYVDLTIDKLKGRGAIFVQETTLGTFNYVYDGTNTLSVSSGASKWNSFDTTNYFTSSSLRTSIKDGNLFSLTTEEKAYLTSGYIKARTLDDISWSCYNYKTSTFTYPYTDSSHTALTSTSKGTDYFWLMSVEEACLYFDDPLQNTTSAEYDYCHAKIQWKPSGSGLSFWLRSPCYYIEGSKNYNDVTCVYSDGSFYVYYALYSRGVRAAFQLA